MPTITLEDQKIASPLGARLSEIIAPTHSMDFPCAGIGRCGKCRVRAEGALSPVSDLERQHLTDEELALGLRLACCTRVLGDARVTLPERAARQICAEGTLPDFIEKPLFGCYGAAVDIGTTTLAARLYSAAGMLAQATAPNPQAAFGADVISRVGRALSGEAAALAESIQQGLNALLADLCGQAKLPTHAIDTLVITGNTAMLYLLTQTNPDCLSHAPFEADRLFGEGMPAEELGLPCAGASVYLPRCISAFVGADITCALLASEICSKSETQLLADIGTNGEMALWDGKRLLCCSTAAGPAFEGVGLSMGMAGKSGAVDHVWTSEGKLRAQVIGGGAPQGICGSGIVDALACLLQTGQLDETGALEEETAIIAAPVRVTQQDVRAVQLAKSAVRAGMETLLQTAGVAPDSVQSLQIAGGFGSYLDVKSAAAIGLISPALAQKARAIGNAALTGACMLLLNGDFIQASIDMVQQAQTLELSTSAAFMELYVENMLFETEIQ